MIDAGGLMPSDDPAAKLIAFYLPQYHPIPENDRWWGPGFTEWRNVVQARPLFPGHKQPHLPRELGFYDLRLAETREAQAALAREHGVYGFCYYHYWFGGKLLLDRPLREVLESGKPDFPFCLCWANEDWTRSWDGRSGEILMAQVHSPEDDLEHIAWLCGVFSDRRYIRLDGKPLLLVYRAKKLRDPAATLGLWREYARRNGVGELFICRVESFSDEHDDPGLLGFDAAVEFQPDWTNLPPAQREAGPRIFDYAAFAERQRAKPQPPYRRFRCLTPGWDNTARQREHATVFHGSTPGLYEGWLSELVAAEQAKPAEQRLIFVNAWNEWAEGAHLEPDLEHGLAYLEATKRGLQAGAASRPGPRHAWELLTDPNLSGAEGQYREPRNDVLALLARPPGIVLDVACGNGITSAELKRRYPAARVIGIELNPASAQTARERIDAVFEGDIERFDFAAAGIAPASIDTVLLLDILEHIYDPWSFLRRLRAFLAPHAHLIASIPNARNLWLISQIAAGRFPYAGSGLLDVTHVRFFTRSDVQRLFTENGYRIDRMIPNYDERLEALRPNASGPSNVETPQALFKNLSPEDLDELKTLQFYLRATPG
jgi:2-polyprenyl-3-methyl-5-hydroxy-6-metoxy-1,4-benzoquinol methylase